MNASNKIGNGNMPEVPRNGNGMTNQGSNQNQPNKSTGSVNLSGNGYGNNDRGGVNNVSSLSFFSMRDGFGSLELRRLKFRYFYPLSFSSHLET